MLTVENIHSYYDKSHVLEGVSLTVNPGELVTLLGRNGAGKTTLLHSIMGLRAIDQGNILFDGQSISDIPQRELATKLGILFQQGIESMPATVFETVMLGRHPHIQSLLRDEPKDIEIASSALAAFDLDKLSNRSVDTLSGGELQRLALAMLVAQTPQVFLLDEPSNHLDIAFQVKLLSVLKEKIQEKSASLIMATHDINLAMRFCDNIILMLEGGECLVGERDEILTEKNLSQAYGCSISTAFNGERKLFYPEQNNSD